HRGGILRRSLAPAPGVPAPLATAAERLIRRLMEHLGYVGVLALELFEVDGELLANEMAPRVHNSGHWTIEGAETSQFENHVRAPRLRRADRLCGDGEPDRWLARAVGDPRRRRRAPASLRQDAASGPQGGTRHRAMRRPERAGCARGRPGAARRGDDGQRRDAVAVAGSLWCGPLHCRAVAPTLGSPPLRT